MNKRTFSIGMALLLGCSLFAQQPKIVVGVVVDQMRYDYLYRFADRYGKGGFKKLLKEGYSFDSTHYNYAPTYTGPGHASIYTGLIPSQHGIIANDWYEARSGKLMYCTQDTILPASLPKEIRQSPRNLKAKTLGDAMKAKWPASKVYGVAIKDRGAILPAGKKPDGAYWFNAQTGMWVTNTYYMEAEPEWVTSFNEMQLPDKYLSAPWNTLYPLNTYIKGLPDSNGYEALLPGEKAPVFPHPLDQQKARTGNYSALLKSPYGNTLTLDFALELIQREGLGVDETPDFISISFSSTDYVGHTYGISSVETEDTYLRLDKELEKLISFLEKDFGKDGFILFLTGDHGAGENALYLQAQGKDAGLFPENKVMEHLLSDSGNVTSYTDARLWRHVENQQLYLDMSYLSAMGLSLEGAAACAEARLKALPGVMDVVPMQQDTAWGRAYYPGRSGDLVIRLKPDYAVYGTTGSTHGSPYTYDTHVPFVLYGAGVKKGKSPVYTPITQIAEIISERMGLPLRKIQQQ